LSWFSGWGSGGSAEGLVVAVGVEGESYQRRNSGVTVGAVIGRPRRCERQRSGRGLGRNARRSRCPRPAVALCLLGATFEHAADEAKVDLLVGER
jgi:hypothetical protein